LRRNWWIITNRYRWCVWHLRQERENEIISKVSFILLDFVVPVVEYNVSVDPILLAFLLLVLLNVVNEVAFDIPNTPKDFL
jgi:hypothetical protein